MSLNKFKNLPLRLGVGIVLLNSDNKVFVGKRIDNPVNFWQLPQGGVDKNEDLLCAANRELKEETSVESVKLIKEIDKWLSYPNACARPSPMSTFSNQRCESCCLVS